MGFEVFDKSKAAYGRKPNVTIQPRGLISINQSAYRKMGEPKFVVLMYDREERLIGIGPTSDADKGYRVRVANRSGSPATISGSAFFNYYDLGVDETQRWAPTFDEGLLIVDLKVPGRTVGNHPTGGGDDPVDDEDE